MPNDFLNPNLSLFSLTTLAKPIVLFLLAIYFIFSLLVVRQIQLLCAVLKTTLTPFLNFLTYLNLFSTIGAILLTILIL